VKSKMCERCEEEERRDGILKSFEDNKQLSCSVEKPTDIKLDLKILADEEYNKWYKSIAAMSKQLKDCILSALSFSEKLQKLYDQLHYYDLKKDKIEISKLIRTIEDYAQMAKVNDSVIEKTAEMIREKTVGAS
jgi:hypothetical protein